MQSLYSNIFNSILGTSGVLNSMFSHLNNAQTNSSPPSEDNIINVDFQEIVEEDDNV